MLRAPHKEIASWLYCFTMSSVSRRHTAYIEGSHGGEDVGRNPLVTYATRVTLGHSRSFIPLDTLPAPSSLRQRVRARFSSARSCGNLQLRGAESARLLLREAPPSRQPQDYPWPVRTLIALQQLERRNDP